MPVRLPHSQPDRYSRMLLIIGVMETGPVTTVSMAGTYTVFATDTITGCSGSASATIHPLPDLCIVPQGCYEACNPDTI